MITLNGIRNGICCGIAFGIVACASAPPPVEKLTIAKTSIERADQARAGQFAPVELNQARAKLTAAQTAADKHDQALAARMADQADVDAQLAEATSRAKQQEQLVTEMDDSLRDLRNETLRRNSSGAGPSAPQPTTPPQQ